MEVLGPPGTPSVLALWGEGISLSWVPALCMALLAPVNATLPLNLTSLLTAIHHFLKPACLQRRMELGRERGGRLLPARSPTSEHGARRGPASSARPRRRRAALWTIQVAHPVGVLPERVCGKAEVHSLQSPRSSPPVVGREGSRLNGRTDKPGTLLCRKRILSRSPLSCAILSEELMRLSETPFPSPSLSLAFWA